MKILAISNDYITVVELAPYVFAALLAYPNLLSLMAVNVFIAFIFLQVESLLFGIHFFLFLSARAILGKYQVERCNTKTAIAVR
ncbi:hypothetical protein FPV67DRAFT_1203176 [Lyophyllum atratum]|nr:hypothetical protein FPV67DRAFT_1203176 [Lyophyllum atratum]